MSTTSSPQIIPAAPKTKKRILLRTVWIVGWCLLLVIGCIAVYDISISTCGERYPILLSRAFTTDPYRGLILSYCLLAICASFSLQKSFLLGGFLGFFSAFLVSMFETSAHNFLIMMSSLLILFECRPPLLNDDTDDQTAQTRVRWTFHWCGTIALGGAFVVSNYYTSECSLWYVVEYALFSSMFGLVLWLIPANMELKDDITRHRMKNSAVSSATVPNPSNEIALRKHANIFF
jgi:hypothetical protein